MAVSAKFVADFSQFTDAVKKAELQLASMEAGAGDVTKALNKAASAFDGSRIIKDALAATKAVESIGGATKLTASEQARLNATVTEALAKYAALGQEAPEDMKALAKATEGAKKSTSDIVGTVGKLAGAVGIGFSIGAVVNFGKSVFDSASHIKDLSDQLGISTDAVQGFKFAAEQGGSSLDAVGTALEKMNENLAGGSKSTVQALKDAGLNFQNIRSLKPEDAFLAITDAIKQIEDPMTQARVAVELFGKRGAELLPQIKEGFGDAAKAAKKMSEDTIRDLEAAQQKWENLWNSFVITTGNALGKFEKLRQDSQTSWTSFFRDIGAAAIDAAVNIGSFGFATSNLVDARLAAVKDAALGKTPSRQQLLGAHPATPTQEELDAIEKARKANEELARSLIPLTAKQKELVDSFHALGSSSEQIALALGVGAGAVDRYVKSVEDAKKSDSAWLELKQKLAAEGLATAQSLAKREEDIAHIRTDANNKALADLVKFSEKNKQAQLSDTDATIRAIRLQADGILGIYRDTLGESSALFQKLSDDIEQDVANQIFNTLDKAATAAENLRKPVKQVTIDFGELSQALAQLAQVAGGSFGTVASGLATIVSSANAAKKAIDLMKTSGEAKSKLDGILDMATGITGIVSAAIAAGKAIVSLFGLFDRNKGRDLVVDFAETFGGFDTLHAKLLTLGDAGEALWIKLTQGVPKGNPQAAQRVIDEVTQALDEQAQKADEAKNTTEEQAQATIETATEAAKALEELGGKLDLNKEQWKDWGSVVTGILDGIAIAIRNLPTASPGGALPFSAGGGGGQSIQVTAPVYLDGNVLTEAVAYHALN